MRKGIAAATLWSVMLSPAAPALAQGAAPPAVAAFASSAEVQALIAKAAQTIGPGETRLIQPAAKLGPYTAAVEYRRGGSPPNAHDADAEFVYVLQGSGTIVHGGTLVGARQDGANRVGTDVSGGTTRQVKAGDMVFFAVNEPHWFKSVDGLLVGLAIHLPQAPAAAR